MKLKTTLATSMFALLAVLSLNVSAATDSPPDAKAKVEKAAPKKKMKPHSHMEEKTGVPQKTPTSTPDKPDAAKDQTKHFHPRDGK